ncbi:UNVERIFIED_ORG: hypothetical protein M2438_000105 [Methylobacterium sp. SuP10 SLI 274]|uniref:hypothetical protein n=1 Tax=Methylorubrum extorquens TaxID=408 RepID=UPI001AEB845A|nr:hypothetical protein [Methylorubrum extorquens]MDF9861303.1 hypothetical protein [Methylorubrum pseudosasae]MDH6634930.1 hypothetical protein [Methylobacterium sp. SuP10 SLI 274]MDH6664100.1 hypothetical protein [Methylorubrum zatmanii]MCP1561106.1 hypothetical protein [Methylorubrum extorquens]MDF9789585.1 hypothetical protein [Methylorubrum extorquens]
MAFIVLSAIGGGVGIGALMLSYGLGTALACAIPGGSLCAAVAAFVLMARRGEDWAGEDCEDDEPVNDQTDQMVKALREIAQRGDVDRAKPAGKQSRAA